MKRIAFTLIEVLVALSIVSIGLIALIKTESQQSLNLHHLEQKTIANLVASNLAVENRLKKNLSIGFNNGNYPLGNQTWYWQSNLNKTPNEQILKLSLHVFTDKKAMDEDKAMTQLELYLSK
jgi:general secretion pathway protein I